MRQNKLWIAVFLLPTIILFLLVFGIPLVTVVYTSFFEWKSFSKAMHFIGLSNYISLLTSDKSFLTAFINTMLWIFLQCTVHIAIGTTIAIILSKKPMGWKFVRTAYMVPNIISAAALGMIFLNIFNPQFGVVNSIVRVFGAEGFSQNWYFDTKTAFMTVTSSWLLFAAIITILVMAEIMSIPQSIYESAKVDGASGLQTDLYITLPMLRNILGTCMVIAATSMLKEFELIYLTTRGGPGDATLNLPLYLYKTALIANNYGYANSIGTILIILGIISIILISRLFKLGHSDV